MLHPVLLVVSGVPGTGSPRTVFWDVHDTCMTHDTPLIQHIDRICFHVVSEKMLAVSLKPGNLQT